MAGRKKKEDTLPGLAQPSLAGNKTALFHSSLALSRWALGIFRNASFTALQELNKSEYEGVDPTNGHTRFYTALVNAQLFVPNGKVTEEQLAAYDLRIVDYWNQIASSRYDSTGKIITLKYFQWLSLLVTELYLDWYFNRKMMLLAELNAAISKINEELGLSGSKAIPPAKANELNKIAFWEATGAGKTLLMHVNVLQYRFYAKSAGAERMRTILLTPNEGLTNQHLDELKLSGFSNEVLREDPMFYDDTIYVIDSGKLVSSEEGKAIGEKRLCASWYMDKNLVLVDEGHHGHGKADGEHRKCRNMLCENGFSFEYSATFGQAVANGNDRELWNLYAKNILFDYSYKYFFRDGYGKEAFILNQQDNAGKDRLFEYLTGSLLAYYQQHAIFSKNQAIMAEFGIEKPLCVFVGNTVNANKDDGETVSDVRTLLRFLADVLNQKSKVVALFDRYLKNETVVQVNGRNPFYDMFLSLSGMTAEDIYRDMLKRVFGAESTQRLKIRHLKRCDEIVLRVGVNDPFGVISIGDAASFCSGDDGLGGYDVEPADEFSNSAFSAINKSNSPITFLIGSRKFMEGWSSWRVSSMGLLNMGVNEGTQIIQLFGRGVRLKGRGFSLKRSQGDGVPKTVDIRKLETLNIFGIRANYMSKFREYLESEGVQTRDQVLTIDFKVNHRMPPVKLMVPMVKDGYELDQEFGFRTQKKTFLDFDDPDWKNTKQPVFEYDDFAYMQELVLEDAGHSRASGLNDDRTEHKLDGRVFDFIDWDCVYIELLDYKAKNRFFNLQVEKERIIQFVKAPHYEWYHLFTRKPDVTFDRYDKVSGIQRLLVTLLKGYMEAYYKALQKRYQDAHMEQKPLTEEMLAKGYRFDIDMGKNAAEVWKGRLEKLKALVEGHKSPAEYNIWRDAEHIPESFVAILFEKHLYEPLIYCKKGVSVPFVMKPITFDSPSETQFVLDLQKFYEESGKGYFDNIDLYLMRNPSNKTKGVGFAQAGNFYPDFLMWIVDRRTNRQYLTFIDPKGLRNIAFNNSKINFGTECKKLQAQINCDEQDGLVINSIILSDTPWTDPLLQAHAKSEWEAKNVLFLEDGAAKYLPKLLRIAQTV